MIVAVRADASPASGSGHVARCLALAGGLRTAGATVWFACESEGTHLCDRIERSGFRVSRLAGAVFSSAADAARTAQAIDAAGASPDWLVADHYAIDERWERTLRPKAQRIMVIDDLADRRHDCDLLLDQNLIDDMEARYSARVSPACKVLLGPRYALLQAAYSELHDRTAPRQGPIRCLMAFTSGADPHNLTGRILTAFQSLQRPNVAIDLVIAAGNAHAALLGEQAAGDPQVRLHRDLSTLAPLMARADLAIGAAGGSTWERLCLGLPSVVITMAENQRPVAARLHQEGLVCWLGDEDTVTAPAIAQVLGRLIEQGLEKEWSERCRALVDGRGVPRVCDAMGLEPAWT